MAPLSKSPASPAPGLRALPEVQTARERLADIIRKKSFGTGEVTLVSGRKSNFYFNLKPTMLDPEGAMLLAKLVLAELEQEKIEYIGGLEMGAVPIVATVAAFSALAGAQEIPGFFVRKKPKEHGAKLLVEGLAPEASLKGKRVCVIEDVTTSGGSALKAADAVREAGGDIVLVLTVIDRREGADAAFAAAGLRFQALFGADEFLPA